RTYNHLDHAWCLAPASLGPEHAGVVRDRQDRQTGVHRQGCTTAGKLALLPDRHTGAFRENQHPGAPLQTFLALLGYLAQSCLGVFAVDGDGLEQPHGPAEEGHAQQLALEHLGQGLEVRRDKEGFPRALVLGEDYTGFGRNVFRPVNFIAQANQRLAQPYGAAAPVLYHEAITLVERHERRKNQAHQAPGKGSERQQEIEQWDAQGKRGFHAALPSKWSTTAARSSKTRVPGGSVPSRVRRPLPVLTRQGSPPSNMPACRSRW